MRLDNNPLGRIDTLDLVADFGGDPTGTRDSTAAFTAALAAAQETIAGVTVARPLYLRRGVYLAHEVSWNHITTVKGAGVGQTVIRYNGAGGSGSYIFRNTATGNSIPFQGIEALAFEGWDFSNTTSQPIVESFLRFDGTNGIDWHCLIRDVQLKGCYGDGIQVGTGSAVKITNWHMNNIAFRGVGGYCINLVGPSGTENRPITLFEFTTDNSTADSFFTAAAAQGYYNGTNWGKGLLYMQDGKGYFFHLLQGRIEYNKNLVTVNGGRQAIYLTNTTGSLGAVMLTDVSGFFQQGDAAVFVRDIGNSHNIFIDSMSGMDKAQLQAVNTTSSVGESRRARSIALFGLVSTYQGIQLGPVGIEARSAAPSNALQYKLGDRVLRSNPTPGSTGVGWITTAPATGLAQPNAGTITSTAVVTSGSTTVTFATVNDFFKATTGANIVIAGAGVAAANLSTSVVSVDPDTTTIVIADSPSTSVNPATITWQTPTFQEYGDIASYGTAAPTTGAHNLGEKTWKTNPSVSGTGVLIGWICTTAGTPGTWTPMYTSTVALP